MGVTVVVAGGMGGGAAQIFEERGVAVVAGASGDARAVAQKDLKGELVSTGEICHEHATRDHRNCR
jgi:predicted Fe-Mo cluster-binding NifX family protein